MDSNRVLILRLAILLFGLLGLVLAASRLVQSLVPVLAGEGVGPRPASHDVLPTPSPVVRLRETILPGTSEPTLTRQSSAAGQPLSPEPLVRGGFIASGGWSPNGPWLAYWYTATHSLAAPDAAWTPSELQFINPASGQLCTHPDVVAVHPDAGVWTAEGEFLVAAEESYQIGEPCEDFRPLTPEKYLSLVSPPLYNPAISTRGTYQAITRTLRRSQGVLGMETFFIEVDSGEELLRIEWERPEGPDDPSLGGMWRNNWQFLLHQTLERGPLLVSLENPPEVIEVATELFGITPAEKTSPGRYAGWVAYSTPFYGHFLLQRPAQGERTPELLFYHRVKNQVESLPFTQLFGSGFYPPGRSGTKPWLMMVASDYSSGNDQQTYYYREMDALGEDFTLLGRGSPNLAWLREIYYISGNRLALGWQDGRMRVQTFPGEQVVGELSSGAYRAEYMEWSGDGKYLAVSGLSRSSPPDMGLFIFEIPPP